VAVVVLRKFLQAHECNMAEIKEKAHFQLIETRLGVKLDYIVPVIQPVETGIILRNIGYRVEVNSTNAEQVRASKSNIEVNIDATRRVLSINAPSIDDAVASYEEAIAIINKTLDFDLTKYVAFYEFYVSAFFNLYQDVYSLMSNLYQDSSDMKVLNEILHEEGYSQFGLRLSPKGKNINTLEWNEITIEPKINSPGNSLTIRNLCRSKDLLKVTKFAKKTEEITHAVVKRILLK
jgi:hypothetical protein